MPMHDWTRVEAGIFHAFLHEWISEINRALNRLLPASYYALPEQQVAGFGPDVLALQGRSPDTADGSDGVGGAATMTRRRPKAKVTFEMDAEFFLRKKSAVAIRHVSGDRVIAVVEIVSPGNKGSDYAFSAFVRKACDFLRGGVHLLIVDPFPPTPRDPGGVHAGIWAGMGEAGFRVTAAEPLAVGSPLPDMPAFLEPEAYIDVPLEPTYQAAWDTVPKRWRDVVAG